MPERKSPVVVGSPSVLDIVAKFRDARLRPNSPAAVSGPSGGGVIDGISARIRDFKDETAWRRLQEAELKRAEAEMEADEIEMEARTTEAKIKTIANKSKLQEMMEQSGQGGMSTNTMMMGMMMEMLEKANDRAAQPQASNMDSVAVMLMEQMKELREQVLERAVGTKPADPIEKMTDDMQKLLAFKEMFASFFPPPVVQSQVVSTADHDLQTTIALKRLEIDSQKTLAEIDIMRRRAEADIQLKQRELEVEEGRSRQNAATFGALSEAIKPIAADLVRAFQGQGQQNFGPPMVTGIGMGIPPVQEPVNSSGVQPQEQVESYSNGNGHSVTFTPEAQNDLDESDPNVGVCDNCNTKFRLPIDPGNKEIDCPGCGVTLDLS